MLNFALDIEQFITKNFPRDFLSFCPVTYWSCTVLKLIPDRDIHVNEILQQVTEHVDIQCKYYSKLQNMLSFNVNTTANYRTCCHSIENLRIFFEDQKEVPKSLTKVICKLTIHSFKSLFKMF